VTCWRNYRVPRTFSYMRLETGNSNLTIRLALWVLCRCRDAYPISMTLHPSCMQAFLATAICPCRRPLHLSHPCRKPSHPPHCSWCQGVSYLTGPVILAFGLALIFILRVMVYCSGGLLHRLSHE
jgi:hypothetical protein